MRISGISLWRGCGANLKGISWVSIESLEKSWIESYNQFYFLLNELKGLLSMLLEFSRISTDVPYVLLNCCVSSVQGLVGISTSRLFKASNRTKEASDETAANFI